MKNKKSNYSCHSLEEYNFALELREKYGWGEKRIRKELLKHNFDVKHGAISGWIYKGKKPFNSKIITPIPESSKKLTTEKAYVLGTLCGDGWISTGYRIGLNVCDKEFAEYFYFCLKETYNIPPSFTLREKKSTVVKSCQPQYTVMLVSKLAALDLFSYAKSFKTFEWEIPSQIKEASKDIQAAFIRGFADSEGCVKNRHRNREIMLASGNKIGLDQIRQILFKNFGIKSYICQMKSNVYLLYISDYNSLNIFCNEIGFTIRRKQEKLESGLIRYKRKGIRKYSPGLKELALDMLQNGYNYQEIGKILNTSYANVHDWEKAAKNSDYYKEKYQKWKNN